MTVPNRLDRSRAALIVIDVQERLFPAMSEDSRERNLARLNALIAGARSLELPVIWTEQYPAGLGPTVSSVTDELEGLTPWAKTSFSCLGDAEIAQAVAATGRDQWLVAGMETHICVLQTVHDLLQAQHDVHLIIDACWSRSPVDFQVGVERAVDMGAARSTTETALFELLGAAGGEAFKTISRRIR